MVCLTVLLVDIFYQFTPWGYDPGALYVNLGLKILIYFHPFCCRSFLQQLNLLSARNHIVLSLNRWVQWKTVYPVRCMKFVAKGNDDM